MHPFGLAQASRADPRTASAFAFELTGAWRLGPDGNNHRAHGTRFLDLPCLKSLNMCWYAINVLQPLVLSPPPFDFPFEEFDPTFKSWPSPDS